MRIVEFGAVYLPAVFAIDVEDVEMSHFPHYLVRNPLTVTLNNRNAKCKGHFFHLGMWKCRNCLNISNKNDSCQMCKWKWHWHSFQHLRSILRQLTFRSQDCGTNPSLSTFPFPVFPSNQSKALTDSGKCMSVVATFAAAEKDRLWAKICWPPVVEII